MTDYIFIFACLFFFYSGWRKGLLRTILGPVSMFIGALAGFTYYNSSQDLLLSLLISILTPLGIQFLVSLVMKAMTKPWDKTELSFGVGRFIAGTINLIWSGGLLFLTLLLIALIPLSSKPLSRIQDDITASRIYATINQLLKDILPTRGRKLNSVTDILANPQQFEKIKTSARYQEVANDKKLVDAFSDEETMTQIQNRDFGKLMTNPKIQAILQDKELLNKLISLQKELLDQTPIPVEQETGTGTSSSFSPPTSSPLQDVSQ